MTNYYIAHPINHFFSKEKGNMTTIEFLFGNWESSYQYSVDKFMELYKKRGICGFVPGLYGIPLAKTIYDQEGDNRDLWVKIDFDFMEGWLKDGLVVLMSPEAYSWKDGDKLEFHSTGCKEEWIWCKERDVPVYDLDSFINEEALVNLINQELF
jgi:hypothetical protein